VTDEEIDKALTADGVCSDCGGDGEQMNHENYKVFPCRACNGTGNDRLALLRATQAVGHLLLRLVTR
jgi:DnaJ-class molecular chaperone